MAQKKLDVESSAGQTYLTLIQGTINAMRSNSALCKTLCVTLVAAIGAISVTAQQTKILWIAIIPIMICGVLDAVYLSLEKGYRNKYNEIVDKLRVGELAYSEVYDMSPPSNYMSISACCMACKSWSVWGVYLSLLALVLFVGFIV